MKVVSRDKEIGVRAQFRPFCRAIYYARIHEMSIVINMLIIAMIMSIVIHITILAYAVHMAIAVQCHIDGNPSHVHKRLICINHNIIL